MKIRYSFGGKHESIIRIFDGQEIPKLPHGSELEGVEIISETDYVLVNNYVRKNNISMIPVIMYGKYPPNLSLVEATVKLIVRLEIDPPYYNPPNVIHVHRKMDIHASRVVSDIGVDTFYEKVIFGKVSEFVNLFQSGQNRVRRLIFQKGDHSPDCSNTITDISVSTLDLSEAPFDVTAELIRSFRRICYLIIPKVCLPLILPDVQIGNITICDQCTAYAKK